MIQAIVLRDRQTMIAKCIPIFSRELSTIEVFHIALTTIKFRIKEINESCK